MTITLIIVFICLLILSAFFSSSETALFSISTSSLERWHEKGNKGQKVAANLMTDHHATLTAILIGTNFVNILAAVVFKRIWGPETESSTLLCGLVTTAILLVFAEVSPKAFAFVKAQRLAEIVSIPIFYMRQILKPLIILLKGISSSLLKKVDKPTQKAITAEEFETYIQISKSMGIFDENETRVLEKVFDLREVKVSQLMIPRTNISVIDINASVDELVLCIQKFQHNYIPVVDQDLDGLIGLLDVKAFMSTSPEDKQLWKTKFCQKTLFIPENCRLTQALKLMRDNMQGQLFVVDEYGGLEGYITAEDILEFIVGDLSDEYDQPQWQLIELSDRNWRISALIPLSVLEDELNIKFPNHHADTLGGFIIEKLDNIPKTGEIWGNEQMILNIQSMSNKRIMTVDLHLYHKERAS